MRKAALHVTLGTALDSRHTRLAEYTSTTNATSAVLQVEKQCAPDDIPVDLFGIKKENADANPCFGRLPILDDDAAAPNAKHVVVLLHGFKGATGFRMRVWKRMFQNENVHVLMFSKDWDTLPHLRDIRRAAWEYIF